MLGKKFTFRFFPLGQCLRTNGRGKGLSPKDDQMKVPMKRPSKSVDLTLVTREKGKNGDRIRKSNKTNHYQKSKA